MKKQRVSLESPVQFLKTSYTVPWYISIISDTLINTFDGCRKDNIKLVAYRMLCHGAALVKSKKFERTKIDTIRVCTGET